MSLYPSIQNNINTSSCESFFSNMSFFDYSTSLIYILKIEVKCPFIYERIQLFF